MRQKISLYNSVMLSATNPISDKNRDYFAGLNANNVAMHGSHAQRLNVIQDMQTQIEDLYVAVEAGKELVAEANKRAEAVEAKLRKLETIPEVPNMRNRWNVSTVYSAGREVTIAAIAINEFVTFVAQKDNVGRYPFDYCNAEDKANYFWKRKGV